MLKKSQFFSRLTQACDDARHMRALGHDFVHVLREHKLIPPHVRYADSEIKKNPIFTALDVGSKTDNLGPPYSAFAVAERAWETYEAFFKGPKFSDKVKS